MNAPDFEVVAFRMLDTGIGQEQGFASDAAFLEAMRAERAALSDVERHITEDYEREMDGRLLFGPLSL